MKMRKLSLAVITALSLVIGVVVPVFANLAGPSGQGGVFRANNAYHWYAYAPTAGPDIVNAFEWSRTNDFESTDLVTSFRGAGVGDSSNWDIYVSKCYNSCVSNPDFDGEVACKWLTTRSDGSKVCNHWHVYINGRFTDGYNATTLRGLACHESGHTVGLTHTSTRPDFYECMFNATPGRTSNRLGPHNRGHINAYLP